LSWGSAGSIGVGNSKASGTTLVLTTTATAEAGNVVFLVIASDNVATADGNTSEVSSIADSAGGNTWTKAREFCNAQGAANAGTTLSFWYSKLVNQIASGGTITVTFANTITAKAISAQEFTMASGSLISIVDAADLPNDVLDVGSMTTATLPSNEYLFFRAIAGETTTAIAFTPTTNFTEVTRGQMTGGLPASNQSAFGEFRIVTSTAQTSNPTTIIGDYASSFVVFKELVVQNLSGASGIATGEAVGAEKVNHSLPSGGGIASAFAVGIATISLGVSLVGGLASAEAFGSASVKRLLSVAGGIVSAELFGAGSLGGFLVSAGGIASGEAFSVVAVGKVPTFVAAGSVASSSSGGNVFPSLPAGFAAGHYHVCVVGKNATTNAPTMFSPDWDVLLPHTIVSGAGGTIALSIFGRRAQAGDVVPTVFYAGTNAIIARIAGYHGVALAATIAAEVVGTPQGNASVDTTLTCPPIVTLTDFDRVLLVGAAANGGNFTGYSGVPPPVERIDSGIGAQAAIVVADFFKTPAGSTSAQDSTITIPPLGNARIGVQIALRPPTNVATSGAGGIGSSEAFGVASIGIRAPGAGAIATGEALGVASVKTRLNDAGGIVSAEAFGSASVNGTLGPSSILSAEVFGVASISQRGFNVGGIESAEVFGKPLIYVGPLVAPVERSEIVRGENRFIPVIDGSI